VLTFTAASPVIQGVWCHPTHHLYGVFNVQGFDGQIAVSLSDGEYPDLLGAGSVSVRDGKTVVPESAVVLQVEGQLEPRPIFSDLLDFHL
jgi:hypothetical protein